MGYINIPLLAAVISWVLAQTIKTFAYAIKHKTFNPERIFGAGGMPSAHSATVCSLVIVISRTDGFKSTEFALSMVLALIVMYDAIGVRRSAGMHAREINRLRRIIFDYENKNPSEQLEKQISENAEEDEIYCGLKEKELKEILGHTPIEVIFGALLGILIGMLFSF